MLMRLFFIITFVGWVVGASIIPITFEEVLKVFVRGYKLFPPPTVTFNEADGRIVLESELHKNQIIVHELMNKRNGMVVEVM